MRVEERHVEPRLTRDSGRGADESRSELAARAAEIGSDASAVWLAVARRWSERARADRTWSPDDVMADTTDLFEQFTPIVERSLGMWIDFLRPWAVEIDRRHPELDSDE